MNRTGFEKEFPCINTEVIKLDTLAHDLRAGKIKTLTKGILKEYLSYY